MLDLRPAEVYAEGHPERRATQDPRSPGAGETLKKSGIRTCSSTRGARRAGALAARILAGHLTGLQRPSTCAAASLPRRYRGPAAGVKDAGTAPRSPDRQTVAREGKARDKCAKPQLRVVIIRHRLEPYCRRAVKAARGGGGPTRSTSMPPARAEMKAPQRLRTSDTVFVRKTCVAGGERPARARGARRASDLLSAAPSPEPPDSTLVPTED